VSAGQSRQPLRRGLMPTEGEGDRAHRKESSDDEKNQRPVVLSVK
jgi:hypothetical protein